MGAFVPKLAACHTKRPVTLGSPVTQKGKAPGRVKDRGLRGQVDLLAVLVSQVRVRKALGHHRRASRSKERKCKHERLHDVSPSRCRIAELLSGFSY